jgi:hypothetical protein
MTLALTEGDMNVNREVFAHAVFVNLKDFVIASAENVDGA